MEKDPDYRMEGYGVGGRSKYEDEDPGYTPSPTSGGIELDPKPPEKIFPDVWLGFVHFRYNYEEHRYGVLSYYDPPPPGVVPLDPGDIPAPLPAGYEETPLQPYVPARDPDTGDPLPAGPDQYGGGNRIATPLPSTDRDELPESSFLFFSGAMASLLAFELYR